MKVKFWTYTESGGDGSAYPRFFATEEQACGEGWGEDCIASQELEFDDDGVLTNPDNFFDSWDDD